MSKKRKRFIMRSSILSVIAILLGYVFYTNFITGEEPAVKEGDTAPNFILTTMEGEEVELEDLRGQGVFLNFWGTYCPPCVDEMPYMDNHYQDFKDRGVEILAVNVGESDLAIERFVDRLDLTFPVLKDKNKSVMDRYGVGPLPSTYLVDENGEVKRILTGAMTEEDIKGYMEEIEPS
ncbi:thiol-disulfide oxidoreductase ResA [Alteribacillus bidgolensis]|uniref:Peroxiredoxin n=1 Tax=Alteribacillus bidgolensis TaxID=930129 RepID=A0A1G8MMA0_9BACI|nr:thiol-disulfide oxidoreductase ResA [Alteribacillus bidgolensis]SDI69128.1 Peroxiredoxin [Alteribacillus bidgolensis]